MSFSVLMSVYYKENPEFFDLALESNLDKQTVRPDDFVLVCDGPLTEGLNAVIEKYQAKYPDILQVHRLEKNVGLGNALNHGLTKCRFDLVARADSDDICDPNRFEKQMLFMRNNLEIAVCSSHIDEFDIDHNNPIRIKCMPLDHDSLYQMAKFRNPINHMAAMFRKNIVERVGSYQHLPYLEDYHLWVRILCAGCKIANLNEVLVHARVGNGMIARRSNKEYVSGWRTLGRYMMSKKMINRMEYNKNIVCVWGFVHTPLFVKEFLYKKILRRS